jgi:uroporphyrinogen III methyltransferase/synthase
MSGTVYLIGAGPGDPGLLTLRGADRLAQADVVLYDGLSNAELLAHAPSAEHICVGKHGQSRIWRQDEIIAEMLAHARSGKRVARLKGGDPAVFARTAEEVEALRAAEIPFEIVPGITAALAAGSFAGIPITHRGIASAVALVTGHEEPGKSESALDWNALAKFPGTLVIYMGVTTAPAWTRALIDAGKSADTPTAIVRRCSLPDQQTFRCRLDEVSDHLRQNRIRPPAIVILGAVTELATTMNWIQNRPLFGQTVLVTRPTDQAEALAAPLRELGARVLLQPAIEIGPPENWNDLDRAITDFGNFDYVVFCSHNGVRYFMDRVSRSGSDSRIFGSSKIAVIGSRTCESLREHGIVADIIPDDFRAESLANKLSTTVSGKQVLVVRASRGSELIQRSLTDSGAKVTQVAAYTNCDVDRADPKIVELADKGEIDWITAMSSASATNLVRLFGESLRNMKIASLSPVTSKTLTDLGHEVSAEADPSTVESLVDAIIAATSLRQRRNGLS